MHFHAAFVRLLQHKRQRIVAGIVADLAGEHIGPGQNVRAPERGAVRLHLKENGVDAEAFQPVEFGGQRLLLHLNALRRAADANRIDRRPVKARHGRQPDAAHRLLRSGRRGGLSLRLRFCAGKRRDQRFRRLRGAASQQQRGGEQPFAARRAGEEGGRTNGKLPFISQAIRWASFSGYHGVSQPVNRGALALRVRGWVAIGEGVDERKEG